MKQPPSIPRVTPVVSPLCILTLSFGLTGLLSAQETIPSSASTAPEEAVELAPFEVSGEANTGYGAQFSSSSSRLNLSYLDVPQTVNVVTSEFLDDAFIFDSREFSMYVTGVTPRTNTHQEETYFMRGLQTTTSYVEGFLATRAVNRDSALYNRVEYVKGPASAAIGRGEAGGLVNFVQKKPTGKDGSSIRTTIGTDNFYRVSMDYNKRLGESGKLDFRMPIYWEDSDDPRGGSVMHTNKYGIGPALTWRATPKTTVNLTTAFFTTETPGAVASAHWMHQDLVDMRVDLNGIDPDVWYPGPGTPLVPIGNVMAYDDNYRRARVMEGSVIINHQFNEHWSLRQGFRMEKIYNDVQRFNTPPPVSLNPSLPSGYQITMVYVRNDDEHSGIRGQTDLLYENEFLGGQHQFLLGADSYNTNAKHLRGQRGGLYLDLYEPDTSTPLPGFDYDTWVAIDNNENSENWGHGFGYYGQYSGVFLEDKVRLMAGWRKDRTVSVNQNYRNSTTRGSPNKETTSAPRYSISYKPADWVSLYYVHSIQADPPNSRLRWSPGILLNGATHYTDGRREDGEILTSSVKATLNEIGIKGHFLDDRITGSVSYYEISRDGFLQNEVKVEPGANGIGSIQYTENFIADGENASGVELELFGQPTENLTLVASFTTQNGTNPRADGVVVPIDKLMDELAINAKYSLRDRDRNGWEFTAGGKIWFGGWTLSNASTVEFGADQYVLNGGVSYHWGNGRFSVNARSNNVLNDVIYISENSQYRLRRSYLSFNAKF